MPSDEPLTPLAALGRRRFLRTGWPWRSVAYMLTTVPVGLVAAVPLSLLCAPWIVLLVWAGERAYPRPFETVLGLGLLGTVLVASLGPLVAMPLAVLERRRLGLVGMAVAAPPERHPVPGGTLWPWLRDRYSDSAAWRALGYALLLVTAVPLLYCLAALIVLQVVILLISPLLARGEQVVALGITQITTAEQARPYSLAGLVLLPAIPYVLTAAAGLHAMAARALLGGDRETLRTRLVEVSRSRARLVDAFEAERRRIERDLHDGAQSRLLNLTLKLGLARLDLPAGSAADASVAEAHDQAKQLMAELRRLVRGIHPRVLSDRGLPDALRELADDHAVLVTVTADLPQRLPSHVEVTAYYAVVEALNNVAKHAGATAVVVSVHHDDSLLAVEVVDDGRGGADPKRGTGLTGLADRVAVVDGRMLLSSPVGGPTVIRVELPCNQI